MRIVHGRVPDQLLQSQITDPDRQTLSLLLPRLQNSDAAGQPLTYQDIYAEARQAVLDSFVMETTDR